MSYDANLDKAIGDRIRSYRLAKGLSQTDLGNALEVTFQQIQKYEKGSNRISGSSAVAICNVLGVTPNDLFGVKEKKSNEVFAALADPDIVKIVKWLGDQPMARRRPAVEIVNNVIRYIGAR